VCGWLGSWRGTDEVGGGVDLGVDGVERVQVVVVYMGELLDLVV
jgi:hypothetical protein